MTPRSLLVAAKAFLCGDVCADLSIRLVPLQNAVAYYYPPGSNLHSIVLFYDPEQRDFSEPLFLLFHEAGHACQWRQMQAGSRAGVFARLMTLIQGRIRLLLNVRHGSWEKGAFYAIRQL